MGPIDEGLMIGWFANAIRAGEMKNVVALDYLRYLTGPDWRERALQWFETHFIEGATPNYAPKSNN
jgi:predicted transcriptional regulator